MMISAELWDWLQALDDGLREVRAERIEDVPLTGDDLEQTRAGHKERLIAEGMPDVEAVRKSEGKQWFTRHYHGGELSDKDRAKAVTIAMRAKTILTPHEWDPSHLYTVLWHAGLDARRARAEIGLRELAGTDKDTRRKYSASAVQLRKVAGLVMRELTGRKPPTRTDGVVEQRAFSKNAASLHDLLVPTNIATSGKLVIDPTALRAMVVGSPKLASVRDLTGNVHGDQTVLLDVLSTLEGMQRLATLLDAEPAQRESRRRAEWHAFAKSLCKEFMRCIDDPCHALVADLAGLAYRRKITSEAVAKAVMAPPMQHSGGPLYEAGIL